MAFFSALALINRSHMITDVSVLTKFKLFSWGFFGTVVSCSFIANLTKCLRYLLFIDTFF